MESLVLISLRRWAKEGRGSLEAKSDPMIPSAVIKESGESWRPWYLL